MMWRTLAIALGIIQTVSEIANGPLPAASGVMMTEAATAVASMMTGERAINAQAEDVFEQKW
jgi:hypothetical protein